MAKDINGGLEPEVKRKLIALCKALFPDASVWLYGSRARGDFSSSSDIDLALESSDGKPISFFEIAELKEIFSAADIPHKIDVVDFNSISDQAFKANVAKTRVLWKN